jgi:chitodextrinase
MPRKRLMAIVVAIGVTVAAAITALVPITASEAATACAAAYNNSAVYTGGAVVSYNSHNWTAKWWTQYEAPSTGGSGVWADNGACGDGGSGGTGGTCDYPNWVAGQNYTTGAIVRYPNGLYYQATHDNPGYDPTISTWFWSPYS